MNRILLLIGAALFAAGAHAAEVGGVRLDDKASVGGKAVVLNGAGVRTKVFFKIYVGSLYLPAKATTASPRCWRSRRAASSSTCCATCRRTSSSTRWSTA